MGWEQDLDALCALVAPPRSPFRPEVDWARFERDHGVPPPKDYRALVERYGQGAFKTSLSMRLEQVAHPSRSLAEGTQWWRDFTRGQQKEHPDLIPDLIPSWPMWPEPGGFLPFAITDVGDVIGWLTKGHPDAWTVSWHDRGGFSVDLDVGTVPFLVRWLRGDLPGPLSSIESAFAPGGDGCTFVPDDRDEAWTGPRVEVRVDFHPGGRLLSSWMDPDGMKDLSRRLAPASVTAFGTEGSPPASSNVSFSFATVDEPQARASVLELASHLGTGIRRARSSDGTDIWTDLWVEP